MGNIASCCQLILDEGSSESIKSNGLVLASKPAIKSIRIPLSQLSLSDVIVEGEVEDESKIEESTLASKPLPTTDDATVLVRKNDCEMSKHKKKRIMEYLTDMANIPVGISQAKLKNKRKQILIEALKKKLENQLIFR